MESNLIKRIIEKVEKKVGLSGNEFAHLNDAVQVGIFHTKGDWQVWLQRPNTEYLVNAAEHYPYDDLREEKIPMDSWHFTSGNTLLIALNKLYKKL
jgi:hypothetical protein